MPDFNIFKRLFEVRILHGFHLDHWYWDDTNPLPFQAYKAEDQDFILEYKYNILNDLIIEPTVATAKLLKTPGMHWRKLNSGLLAGLEVQKKTVNNNTRFYPKQPLVPGTKWTFILRSQNPYFLNITNHTLRPTLPGRYYFTNQNAGEGGKTFPSLSVRLPEFSADRSWEMGELIRAGNQVKAADNTTRDFNDFTKIADLSDGSWLQYAHSEDRVLLPKTFAYRFDRKFDATNPVTTADFTLTDENGEVVKTVNATWFQGIPAPDEFPLDFRFLPLPASATDEEKLHPRRLPDNWYTLQVRINGSVFEEKRVMLRSDLPDDASVLGLVEIVHGPTLNDFQLLNPADGSLRLTETSSNGVTRWRPPVFEIRLMSRATYWHYHIEKTKDLPPGNLDLTQLTYQAASKRLVTKRPRRLSLARTPIRIHVPGTFIFLPNPDRLDLKYAQNQYYSELFLSTIKLT